MFVDTADIYIASGNGGAGMVSFRKEKFIIQGGPDGGDGGKGGDVIIKVNNNTDTLSHFRGKKHYTAQNGKPGQARNCTGKSGDNLIIEVPLGTQIFDFETNELIADLNSLQCEIKILQGGKGGLGNVHFKTATNQAPTYAQKGIPGEKLHIRLELKLIADVGLVGYPNVGKSSLISVLSNAKPQIADYEFTTLTPHLGIVNVSEWDCFVMADIPGIIEGASQGKGLGLKFLKHIERTKFLLFMLDITREMPLNKQYENLTKELSNFSSTLKNRDFGIIVSKVDALGSDEVDFALDSIIRYFGLSSMCRKDFRYNAYFATPESAKSPLTPHFIVGVSSIAHINHKPLSYMIFSYLKAYHL